MNQDLTIWEIRELVRKEQEIFSESVVVLCNQFSAKTGMNIDRIFLTTVGSTTSVGVARVLKAIPEVPSINLP